MIVVCLLLLLSGKVGAVVDDSTFVVLAAAAAVVVVIVASIAATSATVIHSICFSLLSIRHGLPIHRPIRCALFRCEEASASFLICFLSARLACN